MPWHLRSIMHKCILCGKKATHRLFNTYNAESGYYCQKCGNQKVKQENAK